MKFKFTAHLTTLILLFVFGSVTTTAYAGACMLISSSDFTAGDGVTPFTKNYASTDFKFTPTSNNYTSMQTDGGFDGFYSFDYSTSNGTEFTISAPGYSFNLNSFNYYVDDTRLPSLSITITYINGTTDTKTYSFTGKTTGYYTFSNFTTAITNVVSVKFVSDNYITYNNFCIDNINALPVAPTVKTGSASSISATGATLNATVNANGSSTTAVLQYGTTTSYGDSVSVSQNPVTGTTITSVSGVLTGLTPHTVYHYRVKALNAAGTAYGADSTFTTPKIIPVVTTDSITAISTVEATAHGAITILGKPEPTAYGVCWNTSGVPTIADNKIDKGAASATGSFSAQLTSLSSNTTYYVRAYAVTALDTVYGATVSFSTTTTGIGNQKAVAKIVVYPNPVKNEFQIGGLTGKADVVVLDINGKLLFTKKINANESIAASSWPQGVYIVKITTGDGSVEQKIVK